MLFPDHFLDKLRAALPVIEVVQRRYKLRKAGSAEYKAIDDPSISVNTAKNVWAEFGKGQSAGDIFAFEMFASGCTFQEAVERLAGMASIPLPGGKRAKAAKPNGHADGAPLGPEPPPHEGAAAAPRAERRNLEITKTYDYEDADGLLSYQVCRQEWDDGGARARKKTFLQRRPFGQVTEDREAQPWIWGLGEGVYMRARNGDWYLATPDRSKKWKGAERAEFAAVAHGLYRLPQLREEMAQDPAERRFVAIPEGEKDCDTLAEWGLVATTNSGGAPNWRPHHAEELRGADAVIVADNDAAGRKRAHDVALSLRNVAARIRVLYWPDHWRTCPEGGDVTDWRDYAGGNADKLCEIIDRLPDWSPEPPQSVFNALRFSDLGKPRRQLEWLVKGVMQRGEMSVWFGDWGTGKSFLLTDCGFSIARGVQWFGLRTRPGLVVYQAGEGEIGFGNRMEAYRRHHKIEPGDDVPFVALPCRINLHRDDADVEKLIAEIKGWAAFYELPLEFVAIDTFSAATAGADENSGRDVGPVLERGRRIATETGAHVALVHHVPKSGSGPRGWSGFLGNVDSAVLVEDTDVVDESEADDGRTLRRTVHQFTVVKQKDAPSRLTRQFVLPQVVLGIDLDGDKVTSCVVGRPLKETERASAERRQPAPGYMVLHPANDDVFRSLVRALRKHGGAAPAGVPAPTGALCCTIAQWQDELLELQVGHEDVTAALRNRIKQRIYRASKGWLPDRVNLIGKHKEWVWRSDRRVHGIDTPPRPVEQPKPLLAPGESDDDATTFSV